MQVFSCIEMLHPIAFAFFLVIILSIQAEKFSQQCPYLKMKMTMKESSPQAEILIKILNFNLLIITIQNTR